MRLTNKNQRKKITMASDQSDKTVIDRSQDHLPFGSIPDLQIVENIDEEQLKNIMKSVANGSRVGSAEPMDRVREEMKFLLHFFKWPKIVIIYPLGRLTIMASSDHYFHTCLSSVRPSFRHHFSNQTNQRNLLCWSDCGLAEWIIDDPYLVIFLFICYSYEIDILASFYFGF